MMIEKLSIRMTNKLIHEGVINEQYYDLYKYGIEITISSIIGFTLTIVIGVLLKMIIYALIYYIIFVSLRMLTGGMHANTYFNCNLLFSIVTIFVLLFSKFSETIQFSEGEIILLFCLSVITFIWLAPIENSNKHIEKKSKMRLKVIAVIISILLFVLSWFLYINGHVLYSAVIVYTIVAVAVLCLITIIPLKEV